MVVIDDTMGLENLIKKTILVAHRYSACALLTPAVNPLPATPSVDLPAPEPMQVDSYLSVLWGKGPCDRCLSHSTATPAVSTIQLPARIAPLTRMPVHILNSHVCFSASPHRFRLRNQILQKLNVRRKHCQQNLHIQTIQGKPLGRGHIRHFSPTLTLRICCLHMEEFTFMVLEGSTADIIMGRPWLTQHQPHIQWNTVLETGLETIFEGLDLVSVSTELGLVSVSDLEDSGFCFKTGQDHNCGDVTKLLDYIQLNELQSRYPHRLVVLGFPCNQFGYQENTSNAEILNSLKYVRPGEGYKPAFTIFEKCIVNGSDAHPVFSYLKDKLPYPDDDPMSLMQDPKYLLWNPISRNDISWNFEKFLIGPEGEPFKRYSRKFQTINIEPDIQRLLKLTSKTH
ncbi:Glutathione peroxidase 2 [Anabarilius grahami]|uniref:glutathione peroxidase n=1 Tax=Anabarilius grahami TaxID=495550 RepID=A0A3N0Y955_ANAGA|nr:Glutathione peroxidase 2 [Anabarilius grahami]